MLNSQYLLNLQYLIYKLYIFNLWHFLLLLFSDIEIGNGDLQWLLLFRDIFQLLFLIKVSLLKQQQPRVYTIKITAIINENATAQCGRTEY